MNRSLALLAIGLIFGGGIGFVVAASYGVTLDDHDHTASDDHAGATMAHNDAPAAHTAVLNLVDGGKAPSLEIAVFKDTMSGWNLHVTTENFRFAPEHSGQPHVAGEGHAHVYVNGVKLARLYGEWMHIGSVPQGATTIKVSLNSNDHRPLAVDDVPIATSVTVPGL